MLVFFTSLGCRAHRGWEVLTVVFNQGRVNHLQSITIPSVTLHRRTCYCLFLVLIFECFVFIMYAVNLLLAGILLNVNNSDVFLKFKH
jgi:hypothetical protein